MNKKTAITFLTAGIFSLIALFDAGLAWAEQRGRHDQSRRESARREIDQNRREIQKDRADLYKDVREYNRDREALQRAYRRGASRSEIERLRNEARQSGREVAESRQELRGDYSELRRDLDRYGYSNRGWGNDRGRSDRDNRGWWGWGNGSWNNDWNRRGLGYGRD
jgi:hypothetical protein